MKNQESRNQADNLSESIRKQVRELARKHPGAWLQPAGMPEPVRKVLNPDTDPEAFSDQRRRYEAILKEINETYVTDEIWRSSETLSALIQQVNEAVQPLKPMAESGLKGRIRNILNRIVRSILSRELARIDAALDASTRVLNQLNENLRSYATAQTGWNARVAHFGQFMVPVMDEKVRYAYDTLNDLLLENVRLMVDRMDLLHEGLDRKQEEVITWLENTHRELNDIRKMFETLKNETRRGLALQHRKLEKLSAGDAGGASEDRKDTGSKTGPRETGAPDAPFRAAGGEYAYYLFETEGRGSEASIRDDQKTYLKYFEGKSPVLDIGCGRGEFLSLLKETGIEAVGVDLNEDMVAVCREKNLSVEPADALTYLSTCADGSFGGIFAAQVVEHLTPDRCLRLFREAVRVLKPGGIMVIETINTASPYALCTHYFKDPTHQMPRHPDTYRFLMEISGFGDVLVTERSPVPVAMKGDPLPPLPETLDERTRNALETLAASVEKLRSFVFADSDIAVVGLKPENDA